MSDITHELDVVTYSYRDGKHRTKKLTVKQNSDHALLVHERDLKLDRVYVDLELKFDKSGKLLAVMLRENERPVL